MSEELKRLASAHGVGLKWSDVFGRDYWVPDGSLRAVLEAMEIPARSDEDIAQSIEAVELARWLEILPPVLVTPSRPEPAAVPVHVPANLHGPFEWLVEFEGGSRIAGRLSTEPGQETGRFAGGGTEYREYRLELPRGELGYHRVTLLSDGKRVARMRLIATPERCYEPSAIRNGARVWGPALQLYALRSRRNWGIGDFTDLTHSIEIWASRGAGIFGVNPLHALFPDNPAHASPYSPSNRLFLNTIYLDVERIDDFHESEEARQALESDEVRSDIERLRALELVDYAGVSNLKRRFFALLFESFSARHLAFNSQRAQEFRRFQQRGGRALELHSAFEAIQEAMHRNDASVWGWTAWPAELRDPDSSAVADYCAAHRAHLEFYQYLQWQAERQLASAGERALALHAGIGIYADLAVSMDGSGAESWINQRMLAKGASVGAPPDEVNLKGQNWGLPPLIPARLRSAAYTPFVTLLQANMRHNGALRIDHVMGLERLYWIPAGASGDAGAYVSSVFEDLLGIVALESHRNSCVVVGEDLGTVSDNVRSGLTRFGVLSYRLFYFERRENGDYKQPNEYPAQALTTVTTHDLATLAGFWEYRDLEARRALQLFPSEAVEHAQFDSRNHERARLLRALKDQDLLPPGVTTEPESLPTMTVAVMTALHEYMGRTPAKLLVVQPEDLLGSRDQVNMPGTVAPRYQNWQRKLTMDLESLTENPAFDTLSEALNRARPPGERTKPLPKIPRATYRVQLNKTFTFRDATAIVPYLASLGISHLYCSPYFRARPGSMHGYDIIDHSRFNPEIGTEEDYHALIEALHANGLGQLLDIVPNHVGIMGSDNAWWMDVLENGQASVYAAFFDIDWAPPNPGLRGKVLAPILGEHYGIALARSELELRFERETGSYALWYHEHRFPIDPAEYPRILRARGGVLAPLLEALAQSFAALPGRDGLALAQIGERHRDKDVLKRRLASLCSRDEAIAQFLDDAAVAFRGTPGDAASFDALHQLLELQAWRLSYWRVASDEINYRHFFDINDLAALRMENEAVFDATHEFVLNLIAEGKVDGLRIDHPDGLFAPRQYFERLQARARELLTTDDPQPLYLVVEKILAPFEHLPATWPVDGTTGYNFTTGVNGLFVDTRSRARLLRTFRNFVGEGDDWSHIAYSAKRLIVQTSLLADLNVVANQFARIANADRNTRDFTFNTLRQALTEVIACFPVYRTYVDGSASSDDARYIEWAMKLARRRAATSDTTVFDFIESVLLCRREADSPEGEARIRHLAMRFQQVTSPVTAKGVEDTALYQFFPLSSLNEVGGDPDRIATTLRTFHSEQRHRARHWPHEMLATSTHDTKRSEDLRARINVLSELPGEWRAALQRWSRLNRRFRREIDGLVAPSAADEYLYYQTLLGIWPLTAATSAALADLRTRLAAYMLKAAREAKTRTSWANANAAYEEALTQFIERTLDSTENRLFVDDVEAVGARLRRAGLWNALSQTLIKYTAPGVPDLYQGNELWDFSLVDPDNRRPVDYALRARLLDELRPLLESPTAGGSRALIEGFDEGHAKLYLTAALLRLRKDAEQLFARGDYLPLRTFGAHAAHVCAYARRHAGDCFIAIAPRLSASLPGAPDAAPLGTATWADTWIELPPELRAVRLRNVLDGAQLVPSEIDENAALAVADVLAHFPVAVLRPISDSRVPAA